MAEADMRTIVGSLNNITVDETENENGQKSYTVGLKEDIHGLRSIEVSDDPAGSNKIMLKLMVMKSKYLILMASNILA